MSPSHASPDDRQDAVRAARNAARNSAFTLARETGAGTITRPAYPGSDRTVRDVEPLAGMTASRDLELAARHTALGYIRHAREAGRSWHQIGTAMHLVPGGDAQQAGDTTAEAAYTYAAGNPASESARRYGPSFAWTCHACDNTISDHGLCGSPADDERGHASNCPRLAATIAAWDAQWDDPEADWEAGQ
jgi:hypothetical protein